MWPFGVIVPYNTPLYFGERGSKTAPLSLVPGGGSAWTVSVIPAGGVAVGVDRRQGPGLVNVFLLLSRDRRNSYV